MAEEINGIKIVATITPELDQNATKKVVKELNSDIEAGLKQLGFTDSSIKAVKSVKDALRETEKLRKC